MKINSGQSHFIPTKTPDTMATPKKMEDGEQRLIAEMEKLAQDSYQKGEESEPDLTYGRPIPVIENTRVLTADEYETALSNTMAAYNKFFDAGGLYSSADEMSKYYDMFMSELKQEHPDLAEKDWGFSVNSDGALEVSGNVTDDEKAYLEERLNNYTIFVNLAQDIKNGFLDYAQIENGTPNGVTKEWGDYDVTNENFSSIIDLRQLMEGEKVKGYIKGYGAGPSEYLLSWDFFGNIGQQLDAKADKKQAAISIMPPG